MSKYIKLFGTLFIGLFLFIVQAQPADAAAPAYGSEPIIQESDWIDWGDGIDGDISTSSDWIDWGDSVAPFSDWIDW